MNLHRPAPSHWLRWLVTLMVLLPGSALAQKEPVPDTLDWRDYYPLEVGNTWEYEIRTDEINYKISYEHREITGDTLLDGTRHFVHEAHRYRLTDIRIDSTLQEEGAYTDYVRYDTSLAAIVAIPADSARRASEWQWWGAPFYYPTAGESAESRGLCNLDAPFGAGDLHCGGINLEIVSVKGGHGRWSYLDTFPVRGEKAIVVNELQGARLFNGFGEATGRVIYARVGDRTYGQSTVIRLDIEDPDGLGLRRDLELRWIYPNPVRNQLTVVIETRRPQPIFLEVFDVLGRRVYRESLNLTGSGLHNHRVKLGAPSGVYLLRALGERRGHRLHATW